MSQLSPSHATATAVPPEQNWPGTHALQTGALVFVPAAVCTVPAGHALAERHVDWFGSDVLVPDGHPAQTRSLLADGGFVA